MREVVAGSATDGQQHGHSEQHPSTWHAAAAYYIGGHGGTLPRSQGTATATAATTSWPGLAGLAGGFVFVGDLP